MMLSRRFGMVLRAMRGTAAPLALVGEMEEVTGIATVGWRADSFSSEWTCFAQH